MKEAANNRIGLTRDEFELLVELAYLGGHLRRADRNGHERDAVHEKLLQQLYRLADEAGFGYIVEQDAKTGEFRPAASFLKRAGTDARIGDYDDWVFWDELALRLGERDVREDLGKGFDALPEAERNRRIDDAALRYDDEFDSRGVDRLRIVARHRVTKKDEVAERLREMFRDGRQDGEIAE